MLLLSFSANWVLTAPVGQSPPIQHLLDATAYLLAFVPATVDRA